MDPVWEQKMSVKIYWNDKAYDATMPAKDFAKLVKTIQERDHNLHRVNMSQNGTNIGTIVTKIFYRRHPYLFNSNGDLK